MVKGGGLFNIFRGKPKNEIKINNSKTIEVLKNELSQNIDELCSKKELLETNLGSLVIKEESLKNNLTNTEKEISRVKGIIESGEHTLKEQGELNELTMVKYTIEKQFENIKKIKMNVENLKNDVNNAIESIESISFDMDAIPKDVMTEIWKGEGGHRGTRKPKHRKHRKTSRVHH